MQDYGRSMEKIIITRHKPLVTWLAAHGVVAPVLEQGTAADVRGKHVYGVLPIWLAAHAAKVTEVSMPHLTIKDRVRIAGGDFSVEEMDRAGAEMLTFVVSKLDE